MAQIRSKQIADFLSTVNWANVNATQIANASDIKALVSTEIAAVTTDATSLENALSAEIVRAEDAEAGLSLELSTEIYDARQYTSDLTLAEQERAQSVETTLVDSVDSLEVALSAEIAATNSDVTRIDANVSTEKARIDAILLASDADKDSFAEIVSLINAVDTTNDDALATVIGNLNAEISATNADVTSIDTRANGIETVNDNQNASIDSLEVALSAEIFATNADFTSVDLRASEIEVLNGNQNASIDSLEVALSAEIVATNDDITSIDTRLGSVSGNLVDSVDSLEVALSAEISATNEDVMGINNSIDSLEVALSAEIFATNADFTSVDLRASAIEALNNNQNASIDLLESAISLEHAEHASVEAVLSAEIYTEKGRIDAILLASDADKDSFAEIVSLINQVDTTNDNAFAAYALATDASIDSLEVALSAEISATNTDITGINNSIDSLEVALSAEIFATNADFNSLETKVSSEDSIEKARAIAAEGSLETYIGSVETAHDGRLDALEAAIIEDFEMAVESFDGNGFTYTVSENVQDGNKFLVTAFVNGHKVEVSTVSGATVTLVNPGYVIDEDDTVVITYQY